MAIGVAALALPRSTRMPEFPRPASSGRGVLAGLMAVLAIMLIQTVGLGLSLQQPQSHASGAPAKPPPPMQLKVEKGPTDGEVAITFPAGTTAEVAQDAVSRFDLTLISGEASTGRYLFSLPQVEIFAAGAGRAVVYFPHSASRATMLRFLADSQLPVIRWYHNRAEELVWALVVLPPPPTPTLQAKLPSGLPWPLVANWARQHGLRLVSYNPLTGTTVMAPAIPYQAPTYPPAFLTPPVVTHAHPSPAPRPAQPLPVTPPTPVIAVATTPIYIGFAATASDYDIQQISDKYNLQLTALGTTGLKLAMVDATRAVALGQLLSDLPQVSCVGSSQAACSAIPPATMTAAPPTTPAAPPTTPAAPPTTTTTPPPTTVPAATPTTPAPPAAVSAAAPVLVGDALPAAGRLVGSVSLSVRAQSTAGPVQVTFMVSGPLGAAPPMLVQAQPGTTDPTSYTASQSWDSSTVADGTYTLTVTATDANGKTATVQRQYRIQNAAPSSPTQLAAVPSAAGVALSWQQPAVAEAKLYRLYRDDADISLPFGGLSADERSFVDGQARAGLHHYRLVLIDRADRASQAAAVDATAAPRSNPAPALVALSLLSPAGDPLVRGGLVSDRVELRAQALPLVSPLHFQFSTDNQTWQDVVAATSCTDVCRATWSLIGRSAGPYLVRARASDPALVSLPSSFVFAPAVSPAPVVSAAPVTPPVAPTAVQATVAGPTVRLEWAAATDPSTTYEVYRLDPNGTLVLAGASLTQPTFIDSGLEGGTTYGYVVTSRNAAGSSGFSAPVWQPAGSARGPNPPVFISPSAAQSSLFSGDGLPLMVAVTADAGIASITFAVRSAGSNAWTALPDGLPFNLPAAQTPDLQAAGSSTWAAIWNTSGLPAGSYILRVLVTDSLARTAEQTQTIRIDGANSRAPPATINLQANSIATGVRLTWTSTGGTEFQVLRSQLNASGPFEAIGTTTLTEFLDRDLIPGTTYYYRVLQVDPDRASSGVAQAVPLPAAGNGGQITIGGGSLHISQSDAVDAIDMVPQMAAPPLAAGVSQQGLAYAVSASSLSSGKALPRFHQSAVLTLPLPASSLGLADLGLYQWDPLGQDWNALPSAVNAAAVTVTAPVSGPGVYAVGAGKRRPAAPAHGSSLKAGAVEVRDQWTRTTRVYRNPDGTMTTQLFGSAVNYRDAQGSWQVVDSSLVPTADGTGWQNKSNGFGIQLQQSLRGTYQQIVVNGTAYGFSLEGATARSGQILDPASVSYPGIFPGVGLTDAVTASGLNETLMLSDPSAPDRYRFKLTQPGGSDLQVARQSDGSWAFFDRGASAPAFVLNPAQAWEQPLERGEQPLRAGHATMTVAREGHGFLIEVALDQAWLRDPARRFPVFLDPSLTLQADQQDAYWHWNVPTDGPQWDNQNYLHVGDSDAHIDRPSYQFDLSVLPAGVSITQAQLGLYYDGHCISTTVACGQYHTIEAHRMTSAWNYNSTTSQLTYDTGLLSSVSVNLFGPNQWYYWDVTQAAQNWYSGSWNNYGLLLLRNPDNVLGVSGPVFPSRYFSDGTVVPQLAVTWTPLTGITPPGTPTNITGAPGDGQITVSWTAPTVTGGAPISSYTVTAYNASGQAVTVQYNGASQLHTLVCGTCTSVTLWNLWNGYKYQVGVVANNAAGASPETRSAWVIMPAAIGWGGTTPNQSIYSVGQVVTVSMTVSNYITDTAMSMSNLASNSPYLAAGGGPMSVDGLVCNSTSAPTCTFNGTTLTVGGFNLPQASSHTFTFQAVMQGIGSGCQQVPNPLTATNTANIASHAFNWLNICDAGLGIEKWWTYIPFDTGPQSQALINVANGNLVLQQTDTTSVQAHGQFAYVLRRTYNSQETGLLPNLPGQFGKGWQLNIDDLSAGGIGGTALIVPANTLETIANPLSVTLTDRDGTRHVFTFKGLGASISALDLNLYGGTGALLPVTLGISPTRSGDHICVDQNFQAPPGVHLGLWRYIEITPTGGATCQNPQAGSPVLLGWAAERPDRIRYEFSADGHMLDMRDGNGVDLRYSYLAQPLGGIGWLPNTALGPLTAIYEPRSCNDPFQNPKCRAFRFSYIGLGETDVSDPAGRVTRYIFDLNGYLTKVINPDGSKVTYTYCNGVAGLLMQLCSMTDPIGGTTSFSYGSAWLGPNQVTAVTDRRGVQTTISYQTGWPTYDGNFNLTYNNGSAYENQAGEPHGFYNIDGSGRVQERDDGIANGYWEERTFTYWDGDYFGYGCRRPDVANDNNPCEIWKPALNTQSQDQDTKYVFNDEGQLLNEHRVIPNALADEETTYGYHAQYFEDNNTVQNYDDTVQGGGDLGTQGPRGDAHTLFAISDKTQMLTARGNTPNAAYDYVNAYAADYSYRNYLTTYTVDNNSAYNPNSIPSGTTCSYPSRPTANTGNVCEVDGPSFDGIHPTVTRYTYNTFGERITMTTPKEIAENPHWSYIQSHYNILSSGINDAGTGGTSLSDTFGTPVTSGDRVIVVVSLFSSSGTSPTVTGVTGSNGSFTRLAVQSPNNDTRGEVSVWSAVASATGTYSVSVTTNVASDIGLSLTEYSGLSTASNPIDVQIAGIGNGPTPASGATAATTAANEMVLSVYGDEGGGKTMRVGAGFTGRVGYTQTDDNRYQAGTIAAFVEDQDSGPGGSTASCQWISNTTNNWACLALVFKLATPASSGTPYVYTYYSDGTQASGYTDCDTDLSGSVCAGGWLKGITDPNGNFVAFGYDAAGNVTRIWDRNATKGYTLPQFPGTVGSPTNSSYAETLRAVSNANFLAGRLTNQNDSIFLNSRQLTTGLPAAESGSASAIGTATGWGELYSQGNVAAWASLPSAPNPSAHGWLMDSAQLEGNTILAGSWNVQMKLGLSTAGSVTADLHVRAWRYASSSVWTLIGDFTKAAVAITSAPVSVNYNASGIATDFNVGDKLYLDVLLNVTANTAAAGAGITIYMNNAPAGEQVVSPGFVATNGTSLTPYLSNLSDVGSGLLGLAGRRLTVTGGNSESSSATAIGTATGWGEILAQGTATAWPGGTGPGNPTGNGWILDSPVLEGQTIESGAWPVNAFKFSLSTTGTVTAEIHVRAYKRSVAGTYSLLMEAIQPGAAITNASPTFNFRGATAVSTDFAVGDRLYLDMVLNVTTNTALTGATISVFVNNINIGEGVATPGKKPTNYTPYSFPWRFVTQSRTPDGNVTSFGPDADGNVTRITPPRGSAAGTSAYDITQTYDAAGNLLTKQLPVEASIGKRFTYTYDNWSNLTAVMDPDGNYAVTQYDDLNRPIHQLTTRGPWTTDASQRPANCRQSTSSDAPIPAGRILCTTTTTYDSVNNPISITDASGQTTQYIYDAFHRKTQQLVPRNDGSIGSTQTNFIYDADGNLTDVCSPRDFTEGGSTGCVQPAYYSQHVTYDVAGRPSMVTTYRQADQAGFTELIQNGGFENGMTGWTVGGTPTPTTSTAQAHSGSSSAVIGPTTTAAPNQDPWIYQTVTIPQNTTKATLSFWFWPHSDRFGNQSTYQEAYIRDASGNWIEQVMGANLNAQTWTPDSFDMTKFAGQTVQIYFDAQQDAYNKTYLYLDDVSLKVQSATSANAVSNGGFESGSLSPWTSWGVKPAQVTNAKAHSGTYSTLLGWTASPEAEGDSGMMQQVAIPATATRAILNFWYFPSSTDTGNDRQEVWVLDTNLNKLAQVLYMYRANNQAWVPVGYDMTQFIGKTVVLWFNVHGYQSAGLTSMYVDDVSLMYVNSSTSGGQTIGASTTSFGYDADGNRVSVIDPNGNTVTDAFDYLDRRVSETKPRDVGTSNTVNWNYDPAGNITSAVQPGNLITAMSYDVNERHVDTVQGSDNLVAASAGLVDANGGSNVRSRVAYDRDGHVVATFDPRAFTSSTSTPDATFMHATDVDANGRPITVYSPRYDGGAHSDLGLSSTQTSQCPTGASPQAQAYPSGVGVCISGLTYDWSGQRHEVLLPTGDRTVPTFVRQGSFTIGGTFGAQTFSQTGTAGDLALIGAVVGNGGQTPAVASITDNGGNTWTRIGEAITSNTVYVDLWAAYNIAAFTSITVTFGGTSSGGFLSGHLGYLEYSHVAGLDTSATAVSNSATSESVSTSGSVHAGEVAVSTMGFWNNQSTATSVSPGYSWIDRVNPGPIANDNSLDMADVASTTTGVQTASWTTTNAVNSGQVIATFKASNNRYIAYNYTDDHLLQSVDAPDPSSNGNRIVSIAYQYDENGRPVKITDALGHVKTISYFADGLTNQVCEPPNGSQTHCTSYRYDANGNQIAVTDARNLTTQYTYYADNKLADIRDAVGHDTHYTYDLGGRTASVCSPSCMARDATNPSGTPTTYQYFKDNLLQWSKQPFKGDGSQLYQTVYGYDSAGRKTSQDTELINSSGGVITDPGAQTFTYYNDNRLHTQVGRGGSATITDAYDPAGNITSATDSTNSNGTITSTFYLDSKPRTVDNGTKTNKYTYDGTGQTAARADVTDGGATVSITTYAYGDAEVPTSMTASAPAGTTTWTYNQAGQQTRENDPNGQYTTFLYYSDNTLQKKTLLNSSNTVLNSWTYTYDPVFHQLSQVTPSLSTYYQYDNANRVCYYSTSSAQSSCSPATYTYDNDGNRLTAPGLTFTYNADDSMNNVNGGTPFSYYAFQAVQSDGQTYAYDGHDRMTGAGTGSYQYDALDRQRNANGTAIQYDGFSQNPAIETVSGSDRIYALDPYGMPKALQNGGTSEYLTDDGHGNIASASTGQSVTCALQYDPWGKPIAGQSTTNPCQGAGGTQDDLFYRSFRRDASNGDYQFGSRIYDPTKAGFLSSDVYRTGSPSQNQGLQLDPLTMDRYNYVNGDPVNLVDPDGHMVCNTDEPCAYRGRNANSSASSSSSSSDYGGSYGKWQDDQFGSASPAPRRSPQCRMVPAGRAGMVRSCDNDRSIQDFLNSPVGQVVSNAAQGFWNEGVGTVVGLATTVESTMTRPQRTIAALAGGLLRGDPKAGLKDAFDISVGETVQQGVSTLNGLMAIGDRYNRLTDPFRMISEFNRLGPQGFANQYANDAGAMTFDAAAILATRGIGAEGEGAGIASRAGARSMIPGGSVGGATAGMDITAALRAKFFGDGEAVTCGYCGMPTASTLDHVIARIFGGNLEPENIVPACEHCNFSKGARTAPKTPPAGYSGPWPPAWWPDWMRTWWQSQYGP